MATGHVIKRAKYKTTAKGSGTPGVLKMVYNASISSLKFNFVFLILFCYWLMDLSKRSYEHSVKFYRALPANT
jgi:hypothetical protein